jgi:hypothetical protein
MMTANGQLGGDYMAHTAEIRDNQKINLTSLLVVEILGGDLQDAIIQARAPMNPEDIAAVEKEIDTLRRKKMQEKPEYERK